MGKKTKLQKYIEREQGEIDQAQVILNVRKEALAKMKEVENAK